MTRAFYFRLKLFVLFSCQVSRHSLSPLGIEEAHILAIDLLALFRRRIGARNVEIPVLHEVVISIASAGFAPACEPRVTARLQSTAFVVRWAFGLVLLDALFKIPGRLSRRPTKTQPPDAEREQSQRNECDHKRFGATAQKTVHALESPTICTLMQQMRVFAGKHLRCSNAATVSRIFYRARISPRLSTDCRTELDLSLSKGFWSCDQ